MCLQCRHSFLNEGILTKLTTNEEGDPGVDEKVGGGGKGESAWRKKMGVAEKDEGGGKGWGRRKRRQ